MCFSDLIYIVSRQNNANIITLPIMPILHFLELPTLTTRCYDGGVDFTAS